MLGLCSELQDPLKSESSLKSNEAQSHGLISTRSRSAFVSIRAEHVRNEPASGLGVLKQGRHTTASTRGTGGDALDAFIVVLLRQPSTSSRDWALRPEAFGDLSK